MTPSTLTRLRQIDATLLLARDWIDVLREERAALVAALAENGIFEAVIHE